MALRTLLGLLSIMTMFGKSPLPSRQAITLRAWSGLEFCLLRKPPSFGAPAHVINGCVSVLRPWQD
jgi:hypothetical protein